MSVLNDIAITYRTPRGVVRRLLSGKPREDRALAILMGACILTFLSQWPRMSREAHLSGEELQPMIGGALMAWIFIAPLLFYVIAAIARMIARLIGGKGDHYGARVALFWALFASSPLILLNGLVSGFMGPGVPLQIVGFLWFAAFMWFWTSGMIEAESA